MAFSAALTTNFEDLLERTWHDRIEGPPSVYTHRDTEQLFDALSQRRFFILKLYGELSQPETVLLAPDELKRSVASNFAFTQFMETLFFSKTLLFVGSSLTGIEAHLGGITFRDQEVPARHYALVAVEDVAWKTQAEVLRRRYGIQVLPYQPSQGFPELNEFLERLRDTVAPAATSFGLSLGADLGESMEHEPRALRGVRFENVGPFAELKLDLVPGWNILLGDNGVGKSSVLKAIALAFCGEDAASYAGRLLRGKASNGTIDQPELELRGLRADQILTSPLFDLSTTRDLTTERAIERYRELVEQVLLKPKEQLELEQLAEQLKTPAPSTGEREEAREAFDILESAVMTQIQTVPMEKRQELLREVKLQLQQGASSSMSS